MSFQLWYMYACKAGNWQLASGQFPAILPPWLDTVRTFLVLENEPKFNLPGHNCPGISKTLFLPQCMEQDSSQGSHVPPDLARHHAILSAGGTMVSVCVYGPH